MKKFFIIFLLLSQFSFAQDTIKPQILNEIIVTALRGSQNSIDIPANISVISQNQIQNFAVVNSDELLKSIVGINIDRDFGIFSKNSSISMRGLNGSHRTLVLLDGIPLNKTDGGGVNWNRINPDNIEKIEIIKGAASSLYGGNAMSGIINIVSQKPTKKFGGKVKLFYGTYNTFGSNLFLEASNIRDNKGFYCELNGFFRKGNGYIVAPDSTKDSLDAKTYLKEYSSIAKLGYQFNKKSFLEVEYNFSDSKIGDGTKIFENDGGFNQYLTHFLRSTLKTEVFGVKILANGFYQLENYLRQSETIKRQTKKYTLYNTDSKRTDAGIWIAANYFFANNILTFGSDAKYGDVVAEDNYKTSTDILTNKGKMYFYSFFVQDEFLFLEKLRIIAGIRYDLVQFREGKFTIEEPTILTDFMTLYPKNFSDTNWFALSPKFSVNYKIFNDSKIYFSYSKGFRPPILDDMCKNGNISKGFKMANPKLKPENLHNFEIGYLFNIANLTFEQAIYYSLGNDFQYFVGTGDSIYTGGDNLKPILKRQNVGEVEIWGTEIKFLLNFVKNFSFSTNYAFNYSKIKSFTVLQNDKDLTNKFLMEVPKNQVFSSLEWKTKNLNVIFSYNFRDKQFIDDENTQESDIHSTFDFKISTQFQEKFYISLSVQDIFNQRFTDGKGNLSPGRFFISNFIYKFF